jgi:glucan biosynthesis protein C
MTHPDRFHALDAVRAFALLSGIVLHATMSYLPDLISERWPIADNSPSLVLEGTFYVIHIFRMAAFFLIAGFFARLLFHRKGISSFIRDRAKRIALPMVVGWVILAPLIIAGIVWAAIKANGGAPLPPPPPGAGPFARGFPLMHLWFLYYLLVFYVIALLGRYAFGWVSREWVDRGMRVLVNGYIAPIVFAIPLVICLYTLSRWPWIGIPTPEYGFMPQLHAVVGFGTAFVFGWLLHRQTSLLATLERRWALHLTLAIAATVGAWVIVDAPTSFSAEVPEAIKLPYAAIYAFAVWSWVFAIIGLALRFFAAPSAKIRYLADSSYWMYLLHLPLVFALQTLMMDWPLHWTLKFPILLAATVAILLASYHFLVRPTFIGQILNGRRYPRGTPTAPPGAAVAP